MRDGGYGFSTYAGMAGLASSPLGCLCLLLPVSTVYTLSWLTADGCGLVSVCLTTCLEYEDGSLRSLSTRIRATLEVIPTSTKSLVWDSMQ